MNFARCILALLVIALSTRNAHADGGIMRYREVQGPFAVTIFTSSDPQEGRPVDVSVMVQDRDSNDAILDATVKLVLTPPVGSPRETMEQVCGPGLDPHSGRFTVAATREQASNKLLYAAPVKFGAAGDWQLQAFVKRDGDAVNITCRLPVSPPPHQLAGLLPYLVAPPLLVALFAMNQCLGRL
jgi:hypothetical protein